DLQGVSLLQLQKLRNRVTATSTILSQFSQNPSNASVLDGLSKEDIFGDGVIAKANGGIRTYRLPSYGRYFNTAEASYFFGIPRFVSTPGVTMDVDYVNYQDVSVDNNQSALLQF